MPQVPLKYLSVDAELANLFDVIKRVRIVAEDDLPPEAYLSGQGYNARTQYGYILSLVGQLYSALRHNGYADE